MKVFTKFYGRVLTFLLFVVSATIHGQTTLISPTGDGGFENGSTFAANGWTVENYTSTNTNKWFVGSASTPTSGSRAAYISDDAAGATNNYTITGTSRVMFWRDVTFPAGETKITLSFKFKGNGEVDYDDLSVFVQSGATVPATSTQPTSSGFSNPSITNATRIVTLSGVTTYTTYTYTLSAGDIGNSSTSTTRRLIFYWENDGSGGTQPPASIDEISLTSALPGTFTSAATGNWTAGATWVGGVAPTSVDNAVIAAGHTVTIDASSLSIIDLEVGGTLVYGSTPSSFAVLRNLTVNSGGTFNVFNGTIGKTLNVAGNITNSGTLNLSTGTSTIPTLVLNGTTAQTISGTAPTGGYIGNLTINNTATNPLINWGWANIIVSSSTVAGTLTITSGNVNLGANELTLGVSTSILGTLTYNSTPRGGFITSAGGKFTRWFATGFTGSVANTTYTGLFPFVTSLLGDVRLFYVSKSGGTITTGGKLSLTYADAYGTTAISYTDGANTIDKRINSNFTVSTSGGANLGTGTFTVKIRAFNFGTVSDFTKLAVALASAAPTGTHAASAGTSIAEVNRTSITAAGFVNTFYIASTSANTLASPIISTTSGNWSSTSTWNSGTVPTANDPVNIAAGHTVTLDANGACQSLTIASGGTLTAAANTLDIGTSALCTRVFTVNGTLNLSGTATINHYGNVVMSSSATFSQTGGNFNIDGNANGVTGSSVASGTAQVAIATSNLTLSGGTLTIVDPHAATSGASFNYSGSAHINNTTGWTLRIGNGVSTESGGTIGATLTFGSFKIYFDNIDVNLLTGTNRFFTPPSTTIGINNLTITSGEARFGSAVYIKTSLVNNGTFSHTAGALTFSDFQSNTATASTVACTVSGSGTFQNATAAPTASLSSVTINNTHANGVTLNVNNLTMSGTLTFTAGRLNIGTNTFSLGASTTVIGTLNSATAAANTGIVMSAGGKFRRWYSTTGLSQTAATATGTFPLLNPTNGDIRYVWLQRGGSNFTAAGYIDAEYVNATGVTDVAIGTEGGVTLNRRTNANWVFTSGGGLDMGAANLNMRIQADNIGTIATLADVRLVGASAVLSGTYGGTNSGTSSTPIIERTGLGNADLTTIYLGVDNAVNPLKDPIVSAQTGNWSDVATWVGGVVPTSNDFVTIAAGHTVTLDANGSAGALTIAATGVLTANANTLDIGPAGGGARTLSVSGTLNLGGGTINHNGNVVFATGSALNMTSGNFNVDGNNGTTSGSVATGTNIVRFNTGSLTFSGGTFTIVDPHRGNASTDYSLGYNSSTNINIATTGTTFKFGDGTSTQTGGAYGFNPYIFVGSGRLSFGNVIVDALTGTGRYVAFASQTGIAGNLTITSGEYRIPSGFTNNIAGNITNNGVLAAAGTAYLGNYLSGTSNATTTAQTISGSGSFVNIAPTATVSAGGTGYVVGDVLTVTGVTGTAPTFIVAAVASGVVSSVICSSSGAISATFTNPVSTTGGTGTGCTLTLSNAQVTANIGSLQVNNTNATGVTLSVPLSISSTLTMTSGLINTDATNFLSLGTATAAGTLSGTNSATNMIKGPFARTFAASRTASGTYSATTLFPTGNGTTYSPIFVDPTTTAGGAVVFKAESFTTNSGMAAAGFGGLSAKNWSAIPTSGSGNLTNAFVRITDAGVTATSKLLQASSAGGTYDGTGITSTSSGAGGNVTTSAAITSYQGYFAYGELAPTITNFTTTVACGSSTLLTINGTNLSSATVTVGGVAITPLTTNTSTQIVATVTSTVNDVITVTTGGGSTTSASTFTFTVAPTVTVTPSSASFCGSGGTTRLVATSSNNDYTYAWTTSTASATLDNAAIADPTATITETSDFQVIASDANTGCTFTVNTSIGVYPLPSATMSITPANTVCVNTPITINSGLSAGNFSSVQISHAPKTAPGTATNLATNGAAVVTQTGGDLDDGGWGNIPIGFNFNFFGTTYSTINVGTNGTLQFGAFNNNDGSTAPRGLADYTFNTLPSTTEPFNMIAVCANDNHLTTNGANGGTVRYWTTGYAPNRVFVVEYNAVRQYNSSGTSNTTTAQAQFYETTGIIEVHVTGSTSTNNKLVGLNNGNGTIGALALATTAAITTPVAFRFSPPSNYTTTWSTGATGTNIFTQAVTAAATATTTNYSLTYTNTITGCSNTSSPASIDVTTISGTPTAGTTTGNTNLLTTGLNTTTLTNSVAGGIWSSDNTGIATVNANTGVVTAVAAGSTNIIYTLTNACGSTPVNTTVNVGNSVAATNGGGSCAPFGSVTINAANGNNNTWVPIFDGTDVVFAVNANGNDLGTVSGSYFRNTSGTIRNNGNAYLDRNVGISATSQPTTPVSIRFYMSAAEYTALGTAAGFTANAGTGKVGISHTPGGSCASTFTPSGSATTGILGDVAAYGTDFYVQFNTPSFSGFYVNAPNVVLPIELKSFSAAAQGAANRVSWVTATEQNVSHFVVERSEDGRSNWTAIAQTKAVGNSQIDQKYQILDNNPTNLAYYRLRSVDNNGKTQLSNVVSVVRQTSKLTLVTAAPVPFADNLMIDFAANRNANVTITILDLMGRVVHTEQIDALEGMNRANLNLSKLANGAYILNINDGEYKDNRRIIKQQ